MIQPRSISTGHSRRKPRWLRILVCLFFFLAFIQTPSLSAQTRDDVNRPIRKRPGPIDIFRPPSERGTRDAPSEPPQREKPEINPDVIIEKFYVTVPDLVGKRIEEARNMIRDSRLRLGRVRETESAEVVGRVTQQSLEPNSRVLIGTHIDVVVAQRRQTTVPRLVGLPKSEALKAIADAELRAGNTAQEESDRPVDEVTRQS
jgi:hypothetical protein